MGSLCGLKPQVLFSMKTDQIEDQFKPTFPARRRFPDGTAWCFLRNPPIRKFGSCSRDSLSFRAVVSGRESHPAKGKMIRCIFPLDFPELHSGWGSEGCPPTVPSHRVPLRKRQKCFDPGEGSKCRKGAEVPAPANPQSRGQFPRDCPFSGIHMITLPHFGRAFHLFLFHQKIKGTMRMHRPWDERGIPASNSESRSSPDHGDPVIFENRADCRMSYAVTFSGATRRSADWEVATR